MKKISIIGAGSHFTPILMKDLAKNEGMRETRLFLMDIDRERLSLTVDVTRRIIKECKADMEVSGGTELAPCLANADFVIPTVAVGGYEAWRKDIDIPMKYGICQTVGDSVGPGGIFRALRHVPLMLDICGLMEKLCPDALLLNYTNPMSTLCMAVNKYSKIRCIGLCEGIDYFIHHIHRTLKIPVETIEAEAVGINHLAWLTRLLVDGKDAYSEIVNKISAIEGYEIPFQLYQTFSLFPPVGNKHVSEFFPFFLRDSQVREKYKLTLGGGGYLPPKEAFERAQKFAKGELPLDEFIRVYPGVVAIQIISTIVNNRTGIFNVINVPNKGLLPSLPADAVIETPASISALGIRPLRTNPLPVSVLGILNQHITSQTLTVEAAITGDTKLLLQALLADPLTSGSCTIEQTVAIMKELLSVHRGHLPNFTRSI